LKVHQTHDTADTHKFISAGTIKYSLYLNTVNSTQVNHNALTYRD